MPIREQIISTTRVGQMVVDAMQEQGWDLRTLSEKLDITYEHLRRITRGEGVPSTLVLRQLCQVLKLRFDEAEKLALSDRIKRRYNAETSDQPQQLPRTLEPLVRLWERLQDHEQQTVISVAESLIRQRSKVRVAG